MNIEKINNILKQEHESAPITLDDLIFIESLVKIIMSADIPSYECVHNHYVPLDMSMKYSLDFLKSIDKRYYEQMCSVINSEKIVYIPEGSMEDDKQCIPALINLNGEKGIRMVYNNTIYDSYTITHEGFHYINTDFNRMSFNWELMAETISMLAESLQKFYFEKYSNMFPEYLLNDKYNMYAIKIKAYKLDFEINLMKLYMKYGYVDDTLIKTLLLNRSDEYIEAVLDDIIEMMDNNEINFNSLQRYIISGCISTHMLERIKENPKRIDEFIYINDNIYDMSFVDTLKMLDLSLDDEKVVILSNNSLQLLESEYKRRILSL